MCLSVYVRIIHFFSEPLACVTDSWAQGAVPVIGSLNKIKSPDTLVGKESIQNNLSEFDGKQDIKKAEESTEATNEAANSDSRQEIDNGIDEVGLAYKQR